MIARICSQDEFAGSLLSRRQVQQTKAAKSRGGVNMHERGLITLSESAWAKAKKRADVIAPLATLPAVSRQAAEAAAAEIGVSVRQVYKLVKRYRLGDGLVTDLAPGCPTGGKGKSRIAPEIEKLISESIEQF